MEPSVHTKRCTSAFIACLSWYVFVITHQYAAGRFKYVFYMLPDCH